MQAVPGYVEHTLITLEQAGYRAYLVGGCVRDQLLQIPPHDWDIATNALPDEIMAQFPKTVPTGKKHGTITVVTPDGSVEITTFRCDGAYEHHRRPADVTFVQDIQADLARRDFTINAIAMDRHGTIIDPFGGQADLKAGTIRAVGDPQKRFTEDALRLLRAVRFSAQLGFVIEPRTKQAMLAQMHQAKTLSPERVRDEMEKLLATQSNLPPETRWICFAAGLFHRGKIENPIAFLHGLRLSRNTITLAMHTFAILAEDMPNDATRIKRLLARHGAPAMQCAVEAADLLAGDTSDARRVLRDVLESGACFTRDMLAISGNDVIASGVAPGKQVGKVLDQLLAHVIEHPEENQRDKLLARL